MTTLRRIFIFLIFLFWAGVLFAQPDKVLKVFELQYTNAQTVLPVIKGLLSDGESIESMGFRLVVHAEPKTQKKINQLLHAIDVPRPTLVVEVKQLKTRLNNAVHVGTSSQSVRTSSHLGNTSKSVVQRILVQDGEDAFVVAGEDIPYASELAMVNGRHQGFSRQTDYKKIRTGFRVRPTLRGKEVDVEIVPFRENVKNGQSPNVDQPPVIDYQRVATHIRAPLNSWFEIGGTSHNSEQDDLGTIRWSTGRNVQNNPILIRIQSSSSSTSTE